MNEKIRVLIPEEDIQKRIAEVGAALSRDYEGKEVLMICVLRGGVFFACELAKHITVPLSMDFMCVSSYGSGTVSKGTVKIIKDLDENIEGKHVLIAEDIVDSGNTLSTLIKLLKVRKPERRVVDIEADYSCFKIPDEFVVGYGLDYDQHYRNLPYIGVVELNEEA